MMMKMMFMLKRQKMMKIPARQERNVLAGCYVIETTNKELATKEIQELYMTLTNVEYSFRS